MKSLKHIWYNADTADILWVDNGRLRILKPDEEGMRQDLHKDVWKPLRAYRLLNVTIYDSIKNDIRKNNEIT